MDADGMDHSQDAVPYLLGKSEWSFSLDPTLHFGGSLQGVKLAPGVKVLAGSVTLHVSDMKLWGDFSGAWHRAIGVDGNCLN